MKLFVLFFVFIVCCCDALQFIAPNNTNIQYTGRYGLPIIDNVTADWPGFHISAVFTGTTLQVIAQNQISWWYCYSNVLIDGKLVGVLNVTGVKEVFEFGNLTNTKHTLLINTRGDPGYGPTIFWGFYIDDGADFLSPPAPLARKMEIIGDSITVGGAILGPCNVTEPVHSDQDNYLTYGVITARNLSADYQVEAISGIGLTHSYGNTLNMPDFYPRMQQTDADWMWDFRWVPDVITIHLGTNDIFSADNASALWIQTYVNFVNYIKGKYSPAQPDFFILCGSTIIPPIPWCPFAEKVASLTNAHFIDLSDTVTPADIGCSGHPGVTGHQKMAAAVIPVIKSVMNW